MRLQRDRERAADALSALEPSGRGMEGERDGEREQLGCALFYRQPDRLEQPVELRAIRVKIAPIGVSVLGLVRSEKLVVDLGSGVGLWEGRRGEAKGRWEGRRERSERRGEVRRERRGERRGEERGRGVRGEREESRGGEGRERMRGERMRG